MAAGGFKEFTAGETLDEDDINDFLMQGMLVFAGTAARGSAVTAPVEGQFCFLADSDSVEFYDGSDWVELSAGLASADFSNTPTGTYTEGGIDFKYVEFTTSGTLTVTTPGFADILVVGGGAGGVTDSTTFAGGGAGGVRFGNFELTATTFTVTIGAGGGGSNVVSGAGVASSMGNILKSGGGSNAAGRNGPSNIQVNGKGGGGSGGSVRIGLAGTQLGGGAGGLVYGSQETDGISLTYTGSSVEYGSSRTTNGAGAANTGQGALANNTGGSGIVIVRVRV